MKNKFLSSAYSLKLKNIILFLNRGLSFFSNSHICNVVSTLPNVVKIDVENGNVVSTLSCSIQRWNTQCCFNVVQRCKFQYWRTQRCFNVDLTLCDIATSYQPKNYVEPTLKCLPRTWLIKTFFHSFTSFQLNRERYKISPYSVPMRENTDQNNSAYGHFLRRGEISEW